MDVKKNMPFAIMTANGYDYKLRISASAAVEAEKKLGMSIARVWGKIDSVEVQVTLLWAALQRYNHGIDMNAAYSIYDDYMDDGNTTEDFLETMMEVYRCSGFMKRELPKTEENPQGKVPTQTTE